MQQNLSLENLKGPFRTSKAWEPLGVVQTTSYICYTGVFQFLKVHTWLKFGSINRNNVFCLMKAKFVLINFW